MKNLENILTAYENDIKFWMDNFGEGFLFVAHREALIPFEDDERVQMLDAKALSLIEKDKSVGSDKMFLQKLKDLILNSKSHTKVA